MAGSNSIDRNKLQKVETPYGNGYYYNGKLYSDQEFESLENSFKDGGNKTPKPGDPGYAPNKQNRDYTVSAPAKKPYDQEFTQFVEPEDPNPEPPGYITSQGNAPAGNPLPSGWNEGQINTLYANPSMNQFQIQSFESQYGSGFNPNVPKSVPATQYDAQSGQAQTPSLANMMDANAQPYTSEYGAYGDVVQRGGDVAEGVSLEGGKVTYENPIYENALRGNWTGENVATKVMPAQGQANLAPTQAGAQANAVKQPQIGAPAKTAKPAQAKAAPNKPSTAPSLLDQQSSNYTPFFNPQEQTAQYSNYFTSKQSALDNPTSNQFRGTYVPTNRPATQNGGNKAPVKPTQKPAETKNPRNWQEMDESERLFYNNSLADISANLFTEKQTSGRPVPTDRPAPQQSGYKETGDTFISKGKTYKVLQSSTGKKFYKDGSGMHPISNDATLNK